MKNIFHNQENSKCMKGSFNLDTPLIDFSSNEGNSYWTIRESIEGTQVLGGIGSGKTSAVAKLIAKKFLLVGYGGLVLTVKSDEKEAWINYCRETGRLNDLIIVEPGGGYHFSFLEYLSTNQIGGVSLTANLIDVLKTVIQSKQQKRGVSDDQFWDDALDLLLYNAIDLCQLAYGKVTVQLLYDVIISAPKKAGDNEQSKSTKHFHRAFTLAQQKVSNLVDEFCQTLSGDKLELLKDEETMEAFIVEKIPEARLLRDIDQFFVETYRNLSDKTRSIVDFCFISFLHTLLREPHYSLFCRHQSNFTPEASLEGKIILLNLPVKLYNKVGQDIQIMFKYIWQRAMERRNIEDNDRPVFLFADESQLVIHSMDTEYQSTARSSRIATVYITQNLPNYHINMGGTNSEYRVKSFLGTLGTKIFCNNSDYDSNVYASDLIGEAYTESQSRSTTMSGEFSATRSSEYELEKMVRPEFFIGLKTGGPKNGHLVEAYVHRQSSAFPDGLNHRKITFSQK